MEKCALNIGPFLKIDEWARVVYMVGHAHTVRLIYQTAPTIHVW